MNIDKDSNIPEDENSYVKLNIELNKIRKQAEQFVDFMKNKGYSYVKLNVELNKNGGRILIKFAEKSEDTIFHAFAIEDIKYIGKGLVGDFRIYEYSIDGLKADDLNNLSRGVVTKEVERCMSSGIASIDGRVVKRYGQIKFGGKKFIKMLNQMLSDYEEMAHNLKKDFSQIREDNNDR
ncbi:MAG: hypothetical protein ARM1_0653 [Candidatus Micrarchaeota archaeon]|nr:MAG: hypothetical protein ARM1_0653 [Candidatus Micrarchaeota archaeon]